jgi:ankyrin repeat protein
MYAAALNLGGIVRALLEAGSDVNAQDLQHNTSLHYAHAFQRSRMATLLCDSKADEKMANKASKTPFDVTAWRGKILKPPPRSGGGGGSEDDAGGD